MTITEFLEARIAEDEDEAREFQKYEDDVAETAGLLSPTRVLAECTAKRALSNLHSPGEYRGQLTCNDCGDWWDGSPIDYPCNTIKIVAAIYSNHPDYEPVWSPNAS